jgi:cytochrome c2
MGKAFPAALFFWATLTCHAKPIIQGYERFHAQAPSVEGGAILYSELGCANCHSTASPIPERKGPVLTNVSKRLNRDWVKSFLENPEKSAARDHNA